MDAGATVEAPAERGRRAAGTPYRPGVPLKEIGVADAADPAWLLRSVAAMEVVATVTFRAAEGRLAAVGKPDGPAAAVTAAVAPLAGGVVPTVGVPGDADAGTLPVTVQADEAEATLGRRKRAGAARAAAIVVGVGQTRPDGVAKAPAV